MRTSTRRKTSQQEIALQMGLQLKLRNTHISRARGRELSDPAMQRGADLPGIPLRLHTQIHALHNPFETDIHFLAFSALASRPVLSRNEHTSLGLLRVGHVSQLMLSSADRFGDLMVS
jgi:hypothetical protein